MDLPVLLYLCVAVGIVVLALLWLTTWYGKRNAGFASRHQLRGRLSARAATRAHEIRPSLTKTKR
ncbi:hypothetical protein [Streptomyces sp. NPDC048172]|uniref:hypothetical protein n=1 Tax=Streptomyces sp. NPDC048172 TaxID=3365505 RepID=UPI003719E5FB